MGPCLADAPHYAVVTVSALKNHGAIDTKSKAVAEMSYTGHSSVSGLCWKVLSAHGFLWTRQDSTLVCHRGLLIGVCS